jgi:hypothetical protein
MGNSQGKPSKRKKLVDKLKTVKTKAKKKISSKLKRAKTKGKKGISRVSSKLKRARAGVSRKLKRAKSKSKEKLSGISKKLKSRKPNKLGANWFQRILGIPKAKIPPRQNHTKDSQNIRGTQSNKTDRGVVTKKPSIPPPINLDSPNCPFYTANAMVGGWAVWAV